MNPKCDKCERIPTYHSHNKVYRHPAMKMLYMRIWHNGKNSFVQVGWICPNCGNMKGL